MKLSPFQLILLVAFGALAGVGVIIFALTTNSAKTSSVGKVVIWGTLDKNAFASVLQNDASGNADLQQVSYVQKDAATYQSDLTAALASGSGPDVFLITQDEAYKDAGEAFVLPPSKLSSETFKNTFIEASDPFILPSGTVAIPFLADPMVLYWNKDLLASAGYAQPPAFWDQVYLMAPALSQKDDSGQIKKSAISMGEYENVDHAKDILAMLMIQAGSPITAYEESGLLLSEIAPKNASQSAGVPGETALRFYTEFADPSKDDYSWNRSLPEASKEFAAGNLALYLGYASEEASLRAANPNLNFAVAASPQIKGAGKVADVARVYGLAVAKNTQNAAGSLKAVSDLASSALSPAFAGAYGMSPAQRSALSATSSASGGDQDLFNKEAVAAYSWTDPDPQKTDQLFQAMIESVTSGASSVQEAIGRGDAQLSAIIGG